MNGQLHVVSTITPSYTGLVSKMMKERIAALLSLHNRLLLETLIHLQYDKIEGHNQSSEYSIGNSNESFLRYHQLTAI